jgi:hypothetical protein
MKNHLPDFVKKRFEVSLDELPEAEHRVVQHLGERRHIYFAEPLSFHARCPQAAGNFDVAESSESTLASAGTMVKI